MIEFPITERLPVDILKRYINTFYGYGKWESDFWFVGIEEGGGGEFLSVQNRLNGWIKLGEKAVVDKDKFHEFFSVNYNPNNTKSRTWDDLMKLKLSYDGKIVNQVAINLMKGNDWGQLDSSNLLIELFPLPSPTMGEWDYEQKSWVDTINDFPYLKSRKLYRRELVNKRIDFIRSKIREQEPKVVVFYGGGVMTKYWKEIIGTNALNQNINICDQVIKFSKNNFTSFFQFPHPASRALNSIRESFWIKAGTEIKALIS